MADLGTQFTDKETAKLEKEIIKVYKEAQRDLEAKMNDFNDRYLAKYRIHKKELDDGKITQEQFDAWVRGQVFQGKQWEAKRNQVINTIENANQIANRMVNGQTTNIFGFNANFMSYSLEKKAGVDLGFGIYDNATVARLIKDHPQILPEWKIDEPKDYIWNYRKVNNAITQGIIQGESLDKITNRLVDQLCAQNRNLMLTHARTSMTGAQNAGRNESLNQAQNKGIKVVKQWMTTLDGRTRDSHAAIDGETRDAGETRFSNGCRYPGDPTGPAHEVYNCRCTLVGDVKGYESSNYKRRDNTTGGTIQNMSYKEWLKAKQSDQTVVVNSLQSQIGKATSVEEINEIMTSQDWFRKGRLGGVQRVNLIGCDLQSAKSIAAAYQQVFEKYPQLIGKIDPPDAQPVDMKDNTYAWCYLKANGKVQVNPKKYNNWSGLERQYERDVESRYHPQGTTAESIVTHEIGHAIDGLLAREGVIGGVTASGEYRLASSSLRNVVMNIAAEKDEVLARYWNAKDWNGKADKFWQSYAVEHYVSRYATKNNKEWFAECFAEYITSANPRLVATEFGKELEKLMEKLT